MKKKITAIFLCIALAATAIVGASLAYFTDTDNATNTFTVGNVQIDLQEGTKKEGAETQANLTDWKTTELMPGSQTVNNVSKIITVANTGKNAAWVWVDLKIPAALLDNNWWKTGSGVCGDGDNYNALHINEYGAFCYEENGSDTVAANYLASAKADGIIIDDNGNTVEGMVENKNANRWDGFNVIETEKIKDESGVEVEYVVLRSCMMSPLAKGETSLPCLRQVYMDWRVTGEWRDVVDENNQPVKNTDGTVKQEYVYILPNDNGEYTGSWKIIATAYAVQADGIGSVYEAITAYNTNGQLSASDPSALTAWKKTA